MTKHNFGPESIWNIDESALTTVHRPRKVVATKGLKQVGKMTSGERGELVTACCAINALGNHIPLFMIFPRKNWQDRMIKDAPTGTDGSTHPSGWMTSANFVKFLIHFKKFSKCSLELPCLMIMDNHDSHISIESLNYSKDNGIHLLTIPPHTSHKTQPLDRTVFGPLKAYYNSACDNWMIKNAGRPITIYNISECLAHAFPRAFTPQNIQSGFRVTGIFPFNCDIFTEDDYLSSYVTDRPEENLTAQHSEDGEINPNQQSQPLRSPQPSTSRDCILKSPEDIRPFPKAAPRKETRKGRKKGSTKILTDTPEKIKIEEELRLREEKKNRKRQNEAKKAKRNLGAFTPTVPEEEDLFGSSSCESENPSEPSSTLQTDDWIIVNLLSEKNLVHRYVGQIKSITDDSFVVRFAKKVNSRKFKWPLKDDISEIYKYQVVKKIDAPIFKSTSKRTNFFEFKKSLQKFHLD